MELRITQHAARRTRQWQITALEIESILTRGELLEPYRDDIPYPSRLVLGWSGTRPIHVVAADDPESSVTFVITAYVAHPELWDETFRMRRSR